MRRVYLDVSALGRQYDDQSHERVRLEARAVYLILKRVRLGLLELAISATLVTEVTANPSTDASEEILAVLAQDGKMLVVDDRLVSEMVDRLLLVNVTLMDALHVSTAMLSGYCFVTCDDRLLRRLARLQLPEWHGTPVEYCRRKGIEL